MSSDNKIVLFESSDGEVVLPVKVDLQEHEVWLNREQLSQLFDRNIKTVGKHINNALAEELKDYGTPTVAKFATVQQEGGRIVKRNIQFYNLDMVLSVGYRVKSKRGIEFRRWANSVLRQYVTKGYAENKKRMEQLGTVVKVLERTQEILKSSEILDIIKAYTYALNILDDYDHQQIKKPAGTKDVYVLEYNECKQIISKMRFTKDSNIFGVEKDESFKSSIAAIYQSFDGYDIYPSLEEKAANLLYFVVKNHSFHDGNKRIAATLFLYFLNKNDALFVCNKKRLTDNTLAALTIMIAESKPEEKEAMVALVMNFLEFGEKEVGL